MKAHDSTYTQQHSRCDARARVFGGHVSVATPVVGVAAMLGTFTAKINPRWVPGGLLKEGNS
jgi:hypothetical protein